MIYCVHQHFSYIMATSFNGGRSKSTRREPLTMGKQLVNFITCGYESSAPFFNLQSWARTHVILVIVLYELLGNPTTQLIEPPGHYIYIGIVYNYVENVEDSKPCLLI